MPPAKFQMSEELRAKIKAKGDFFDISKDFVDKCYEEKGIEETARRNEIFSEGFSKSYWLFD